MRSTWPPLQPMKTVAANVVGWGDGGTPTLGCQPQRLGGVGVGTPTYSYCCRLRSKAIDELKAICRPRGAPFRHQHFPSAQIQKLLCGFAARAALRVSCAIVQPGVRTRITQRREAGRGQSSRTPSLKSCRVSAAQMGKPVRALPVLLCVAGF